MKLKLILLETTDRSQIWSNKGRRLYFNQNNPNCPDNEIRYQIYLTDPTTKIQKGDWYFEPYPEAPFGVGDTERNVKNCICKCSYPRALDEGTEKIIITTDKSLTPEYIPSQEPYGGFMKEDTTVLIPNPNKLPQLSEESIELLINYYNEFKCMPESIEVYQQRVIGKRGVQYKDLERNQHGEIEITIPEVEEKLYTEEEVLELCKVAHEYGGANCCGSTKHMFKDFRKWFNQTKKK